MTVTCVCLCVRVRVRVRECVHVHVWVHLCVYVCACTPVRVHENVYVCVCVYMYVCVDVCSSRSSMEEKDAKLGQPVTQSLTPRTPKRPASNSILYSSSAALFPPKLQDQEPMIYLL